MRSSIGGPVRGARPANPASGRTPPRSRRSRLRSGGRPALRKPWRPPPAYPAPRSSRRGGRASWHAIRAAALRKRPHRPVPWRAPPRRRAAPRWSRAGSWPVRRPKPASPRPALRAPPGNGRRSRRGRKRTQAGAMRWCRPRAWHCIAASPRRPSRPPSGYAPPGRPNPPEPGRAAPRAARTRSARRSPPATPARPRGPCRLRGCPRTVHLRVGFPLTLES